MDVLLGLLKGIKEGWNLPVIKSYINSYFDGLEDIRGCETDVYYQKTVHRYKLTPLLTICISFMTERNGYSYYEDNDISVVELFDDIKYPLYSESKISGTKDVSCIVACDNTINELLIKYEKTKDYIISTEDFAKLCQGRDHDKAIYLWSIFPPETRTINNIILEFAKMIYKKAQWRRHEIIEYNSISPYGGEDIFYFPKNDDECFIDLMNKYHRYFDMDAESYKHLVLKILNNINSEDEYSYEIKGNNLLA